MNIFKMQRPEELKDWAPVASQELISFAKEHFKELVKGFTNVANFVGYSEDLNTHSFLGRGCHAAMSDVSYRDILVTENGTNRSKKSQELVAPFLEWFLHHSPYGFIILDKDDKDFIANYGFIIDGTAPSTFVQCVCIITRHFYEVNELAFEKFNELVSRGIDGFIAYQICFNSSISMGGKEDHVFNFVAGHRVTGTVTPEIALRYYRGQLAYPLGKTYKQAPSIFNSSRLFVPKMTYQGPHLLSTHRGRCAKFHNFLLEKEGKLGNKDEGYRPPNPFAPKKPNPLREFRFTNLQAVTDVADYYQQFIKENL